MGKIIAFATILSFIATASLGFATTKMGSQEGLMLSGKVAAIEDGVLSLREPNGKVFKVAATNDKLKGIHTGDRVVVRDVNGWIASVKKLGKEASKSSAGLTHRQR